jgi:hypothetical protein
MRILALTSWWPEPARQRLAAAYSPVLLRALAQRHDIHLISFFQEPVTDTRRSGECARLCASQSRQCPQPVWQPASRESKSLSLWHPEPSSFRASAGARHSMRCGAARAATDAPDMVIAFQTGVARYALSVPGVVRDCSKNSNGWKFLHWHVHLQKMPHASVARLVDVAQSRRHTSAICLRSLRCL